MDAENRERETQAHGSNLQDENNQNQQPNNNGNMTLENLPEEARNSMPEDAQRIFIAAYNSIYETNSNRETAMRVAWQTIELNESYAKGEDGKWHRLPEPRAKSSPTVQTAS